MTGYHTELQNRLKQLLETFDNDTFLSRFIKVKNTDFVCDTISVVSLSYGNAIFFLVLKVIRLTSEVNTLQNKIKLVTVNSTETPAATRCEFGFTVLLYVCWQSPYNLLLQFYITVNTKKKVNISLKFKLLHIFKANHLGISVWVDF